MTYETAKAMQAAIDAELTALSATLKQFPAHANGLTPDAVKALPEWKAAKAAYASAFARLRAFNTIFVKQFAKEIAAERRAKAAR